MQDHYNPKSWLKELIASLCVRRCGGAGAGTRCCRGTWWLALAPSPTLCCCVGGPPMSPAVPLCPCWRTQGWAASPQCLQIPGGFPGTTTCSPPSAPRVRRELLHLCHVSKPGASPLSDRRADGSSSPHSMSPHPHRSLRAVGTGSTCRCRAVSPGATHCGLPAICKSSSFH